MKAGVIYLSPSSRNYNVSYHKYYFYIWTPMKPLNLRSETRSLATGRSLRDDILLSHDIADLADYQAGQRSGVEVGAANR